jgi:hypothetical protein
LLWTTTARGCAIPSLSSQRSRSQQLGDEQSDALERLRHKRVVNPLRVPAGGDNAGSTEHGDVVRDQVLGPAQEFLELTDATLALGQEVYEGQPSRVTEESKRRRELDGSYGAKYRRYAPGMVGSTLTPQARSTTLRLVPSSPNGQPEPEDS